MFPLLAAEAAPLSSGTCYAACMSDASDASTASSAGSDAAPEERRLTISIPTDMHRRIRVAAAHADQPMADWIRGALADTLEVEEVDE